MGGKRSPWRALRPVFLAGAATLTWLTFSSSTASADTAPEATFLLGGVTTSVSSVTDELPVSAAVASGAAPARTAPTPGSSSGMVQPIAGEVPGLAEHIVPPGPVVNNVVPAGAVSAIAVPVELFADAATAEAVEAAVPPVTEALPVMEPALQPVGDLEAGTATLPLPELPVAVPAGDIHSIAAPVVLQALPAQLPANRVHDASVVAATGTFEAPGTTTASVNSDAVTLSHAPLQGAVSPPSVTEEQPRTGDPAPAPSQAAPVSGSGTGSGATSAGSSGSAACLSVFILDLPPSVAVRAGETSEHAPAPVSFDPGSSPD